MEEKNNNQEDLDFAKLIEGDAIVIPQVGEIIKGRVVSASKSEVKLDINGILMGIVRGPELYNEVEEFADLKPGDEIEAAVIDTENERGELELSFRSVGQEKAWKKLRSAQANKETIKVKITDANKGGLISRYCQIDGFLPVSQLAPENYPRISGGDKSKILDKLKSFIGTEFEVSVINLSEEEEKVIFSEKDAWSKKQKPALDKYQIGMEVQGTVTAITNFGVFVSFGDDSIEGLIHISELAWQRIDSPNELHKVGDKIQAEIISIDGAKVFLSAKKLMKDPWLEASAKYKVGQVVPGTVLKVNPFGLFVKLDEEIHGLAHISQLEMEGKEKIAELYKADDVIDFEIVSISPSEHRLGLKFAEDKKAGAKTTKKSSKKKDEAKEIKEEAKDEAKEDKKEDEKEAKAKVEVEVEKEETVVKAKKEAKKETKKKKTETSVK